MARKGLSIWLFSSLTFASIVHMTDAISTVFLNNQPHLVQLYPYIGQRLQAMSPTLYLLVTALSTLVFWGITCAVAFNSPVEQFLNKILSDAKRQSSVEAQTVAEKSEILDAMYETIEASNQTLAQVVDIVYNVRTEVKGIQQLTFTVENMKMELSNLKKGVRRIEEKGILPILCDACGKPLSPEFKLCPFCGETTKLPGKTVSANVY